MKTSRLDLDWKSLSSCKDYREFIKIYFSALDRVTGKPISYAEFSRRAGFLSRSFPRDVVSGKRPLSAKSFPLFSRALNLNADWIKFFRLLVAMEVPSLLEARSDDSLQEQVEKVRLRLQAPRVRTVKTKSQASTQIMRFPEIPSIYAALGSSTEGASIADIASKIKVPPARIKQALQEMCVMKLVSELESERWRAESFHLAFADLKDNRFFESLFLSQMEVLKSAVPTQMNSNTSLFLTSAVSVNSELLPELKKELQELMLSFVDRSEAATGDQVINLLCGMSR